MPNRYTAVTVAQYFDEIVGELDRAGFAVSTMNIDITPTEPMRGQLVTGAGPVLRWREDLGWSTGARSTGPEAHPGEVAQLLQPSA